MKFAANISSEPMAAAASSRAKPARPPRMNFCGNALDHAVEAFSQELPAAPDWFEQHPGYSRRVAGT